MVESDDLEKRYDGGKKHSYNFLVILEDADQIVLVHLLDGLIRRNNIDVFYVTVNGIYDEH